MILLSLPAHVVGDRHFSLLSSGEASANWLLAYDAEHAALRRQLRRW
jgi:hypothetical protein